MTMVINMKIGLALCYDTKNFGSQLQVLATVKKIESLGYETEIIRYKKKPTPRFIVQSSPRLLNKSFIKNKIHSRMKEKELRAHPYIYRNVKIRNIRFEMFIETYLTNLSIPYNGWENLVKEANKNYDVFLCGSDQLWLPSNLGSHFYTLEFVEDKPKIAYATSFGVSHIPWYQKNRTARYLNRFQSLSTREIAGAKIIKDLTGKEVEVVCDPTLLFNDLQWQEIIRDKEVIDEPYIFAYFLGNNEEHRKIANHFKEETGLTLVSSPFLDNYVDIDKDFGNLQLYDLDAGDFVNLIRHAEYILTDSFHGSVFSIIHHKKFMTFNRFREGSNSRNSRIDSLCQLLGLEGRRYDGQITDIYDDIDYKDVDQRLEKLRNESIAYLEKSLNGARK